MCLSLRELYSIVNMAILLYVQGFSVDGLAQMPGKHFLAGADFPGEHLPSPLLACSTGSGVVRLFDLRESSRNATFEMKCHDQSLAGLALRSSGIMATAASTPNVNELHFSDVRLASTDSESMCDVCSMGMFDNPGQCHIHRSFSGAVQEAHFP